LNRFGVEYLIVGAHCVMLHTEPRATADLDLFVPSSRTNTGRLLGALSDFIGGEAAAQAVGLYQSGRKVLMIGREPWRVDILSAVVGLKFDRAWARRWSLVIDGIPTQTLNLDDAIASKRAVVRKDRPGTKGEQDRGDLHRLLARRAALRTAGRPR
jgi:hypothetical protein